MNTKKLYVLLLLFGLCFFFIGCDQQKTFTDVELCKKYLSAVVEIKVVDEDDNPVSFATGTLIREDGQIITNRHVVRKYDYSANQYVINQNIFVRFYKKPGGMIIRQALVINTMDAKGCLSARTAR